MIAPTVGSVPISGIVGGAEPGGRRIDRIGFGRSRGDITNIVVPLEIVLVAKLATVRLEEVVR